MSQHNLRKLCLTDLSASEKNQQEKKSENVQENADNQKTVQWRYYDNNQHEKDKETTEAE